jgi:hypothetical protein
MRKFINKRILAKLKDRDFDKILAETAEKCEKKREQNRAYLKRYRDPAFRKTREWGSSSAALDESDN